MFNYEYNKTSRKLYGSSNTKTEYDCINMYLYIYICSDYNNYILISDNASIESFLNHNRKNKYKKRLQKK